MLEILKAAQGDEPTSCGNVVPVIRKARSRGENRYHFDKRQTSRRAEDSTDKFRAGTHKVQRSKHGPDQEPLSVPKATMRHLIWKSLLKIMTSRIER